MTECVIQSTRTLEIVYRVQIWVSRSDYAFIHVLLKELETEAILDLLSFEIHKFEQVIQLNKQPLIRIIGKCSWLKGQWGEATIRRIMAERL